VMMVHCSFTFGKRKKLAGDKSDELLWRGSTTGWSSPPHAFLLLSEQFWHPSCWLLCEDQIHVKCGEDGVCGGNIHLGKVHVLCLVVILNGHINKDQEILVLMVFLALKGCCSTEMERVAGSDCQKCSFLKNQLFWPARVFNENNRKFVLLQNLLS
jgi:hypothetical protein